MRGAVTTSLAVGNMLNRENVCIIEVWLLKARGEKILV